MKAANPAVAILILVSILLAVAYASVVRFGEPADEVSHFRTVQFYADHFRMPTSRDPGVTYEGIEQGPVYYAAAAVGYGAARIFGQQDALFALRLAGSLLLVPIIILTYLIAARLAPAQPAFAFAATTFMALNASLLALVSSVQNDALAIVLGMLILYLCLRMLRRPGLRFRDGAALGLIVGVAILTKATTAFLVVSIPAGVLLLRRPGALGFSAGMGATAFLSCGWWFVRNLVLYQHPTGYDAVRALPDNPASPPLNVLSAGAMLGWLRGIASWTWWPEALYRDVIRVSLPFRLVAAGLMLLALVGIARTLWNRSRRRAPVPGAAGIDRDAVVFLGVQAVLCYGLLAFEDFTVDGGLSARTAFPILFVLALGLAGGGLAALAPLRHHAGAILVAGLPGFLLAINAYDLWRLIQLRT